MAENRDERGEGRQLFCRIITPEAVVYDGEADLVVARIADGDIGVMVNHAPVVSTLGTREVRVRDGEESHVYATSEGFFMVAENLVQILVEEAMPAEEIDVAAAEERYSAVDHRISELSEDAEEHEAAYREAERERLVAANFVRVGREYGGG
jgi:F-type H+-transporting ATPase subunit epsilon